VEVNEIDHRSAECRMLMLSPERRMLTSPSR
jgi:hypothetical protein